MKLLIYCKYNNIIIHNTNTNTKLIIIMSIRIENCNGSHYKTIKLDETDIYYNDIKDKIYSTKTIIESFGITITPFSMKNGTANKKKMIKKRKKILAIERCNCTPKSMLLFDVQKEVRSFCDLVYLIINKRSIFLP